MSSGGAICLTHGPCGGWWWWPATGAVHFAIASADPTSPCVYCRAARAEV